MPIALTRQVSPLLDSCALSFLQREPIDTALAHVQHTGYEQCLRDLGVDVERIAELPEAPDGVFVEDTAVVVDEIAIMASPLLPTRRSEVTTAADALAPFRSVRWLEGDARLEGGDVLRCGRRVYVGLSARTNSEGATQLARHLEPLGYEVQSVPVRGCLHLKTACTSLGGNSLLANANWIDVRQFSDFEILTVPADESMAANVLYINDTVVMPSSFPNVRGVLVERGYRVVVVDVSELQKAEAGLTCCSIIFDLP